MRRAGILLLFLGTLLISMPAWATEGGDDPGDQTVACDLDGQVQTEMASLPTGNYDTDDNTCIDYKVTEVTRCGACEEVAAVAVQDCKLEDCPVEGMVVGTMKTTRQEAGRITCFSDNVDGQLLTYSDYLMLWSGTFLLPRSVGIPG